MPLMRTTPPAKALKTERTPEENQERAYIAASRRNDRSVEARVESARRASEIHKRRTGRSLRVTEQDVINEEMYEEEDDDLALQYRRLTAHLQTGSADFNRRLAAYLTNQMATRSVMEQLSQSPYGQYPGTPYQDAPNMYPLPMLSQQGLSPASSTYQRQASNPSPHHPGFRQAHGRAYSMQGVPQPHAPLSPPLSASHGAMDPKRMSTTASAHPDLSSGHQIHAKGLKPDAESARQIQSATLTHGGSSSFAPPSLQGMASFTTSLPSKPQQMLAHAPGFDIHDPSYVGLLWRSDQYVNSPYYPWQNQHGGIKGMPVDASAYQGMSTTLPPAALEHHSDHTSKVSSTVASTPATKYASVPAGAVEALPGAGPDFNFSQENKDPILMSMAGAMPTGSGQVTPAGETFWDHFVMDNSWEDSVGGHASFGASNPGSV